MFGNLAEAIVSYFIDIPVRHAFKAVPHDAGGRAGLLKLVRDGLEQVPQSVEPSRENAGRDAHVAEFAADCVATGLDACARFFKTHPFVTVGGEEYELVGLPLNGWRLQAFLEGFYRLIPYRTFSSDVLFRSKLRSGEVVVSGFEVKGFADIDYDGFLIRRSLVRAQPGAFSKTRGFLHNSADSALPAKTAGKGIVIDAPVGARLAQDCGRGHDLDPNGYCRICGRLFGGGPLGHFKRQATRRESAEIGGGL